MTDSISAAPRGFAASVPGAGHIRYAMPCQDASGVVVTPRPAAIVCDGRGSAKLSHFGAQGAVRAFFSQLNVLEPFLAGVLDRESSEEKWTDLCRLLYRTLLQVKLDLAQERGGEEKDFDFTVAFAVAGTVSIGCFQVGDGAIVLRRSGVCRTAFSPDKGEFANQTQFLRPGGDVAGKFHACLSPVEGNEGVVITSDGPEYLMFQLATMEPGPIFGKLLDDLAGGELCEQDLRDYLTRSVWASDQRGSDDRSIAVLLPAGAHDSEDVTGMEEKATGESECSKAAPQTMVTESAAEPECPMADSRLTAAEYGASDCESQETMECCRVPSRRMLPALIAASFLIVFFLIALEIGVRARKGDQVNRGLEGSAAPENTVPDASLSSEDPGPVVEEGNNPHLEGALVPEFHLGSDDCGGNTGRLVLMHK